MPAGVRIIDKRGSIYRARRVAWAKARLRRALHSDVVTRKDGGLASLGPPYDSTRFHSLTSGPFSPITGSVFGSLTAGMVFSAFA